MNSNPDDFQKIAPVRIQTDGKVRDPGNKVRFISADTRTSPRRRGTFGRSDHRRRRFMHRLKKISLAAIPFLLFLLGLTLVSVGFFSFVENESVLAVFITSRDASGSSGLTDLNTLDPSASQPAEETAAEGAGGRLVVPLYYNGETVGTIRIPSVDIDVTVYQGDEEDKLRLGAGHCSTSLFPGQDGNIVVAAHRTSYFRNFEYLKVGDTVEFETTYGKFTYQVREINILSEFYSIVEDTDNEQLTMYTCYPFVYVGNAPQRCVVLCDLVGSELNT